MKAERRMLHRRFPGVLGTRPGKLRLCSAAGYQRKYILSHVMNMYVWIYVL
jgi:hypothetical protein